MHRGSRVISLNRGTRMNCSRVCAQLFSLSGSPEKTHTERCACPMLEGQWCPSVSTGHCLLPDGLKGGCEAEVSKGWHRGSWSSHKLMETPWWGGMGCPQAGLGLQRGSPWSGPMSEQKVWVVPQKRRYRLCPEVWGPGWDQIISLPWCWSTVLGFCTTHVGDHSQYLLCLNIQLNSDLAPPPKKKQTKEKS